jgi:hypothetical protein
MIISGEAIAQLDQELGETPLKYSGPVLTTLLKGLRPMPEATPQAAPASKSLSGKIILDYIVFAA